MEETRSFNCLPSNSWLGGVCSGLAYWLGWPVWIVRLLTFLFIWSGGGLVVYLLLWVFVPNAETPADYGQRTGDTG